MPATNYESSSYENGCPVNSESYTYYPTWFNGVNMPKSTGLVEEVQRETKSVYGRQVEEVVISGVSGRFQESENVEEFAQRLFKGVEESKRYGLQNGNGMINGGEKTTFDAEFYGVSPRQVENMSTQMKSLVEVTYEAIFDSGMNPSELRGSRTGVFIGTTGQEEEICGEQLVAGVYTKPLTNGIAQLLSSVFDLRGPAQTLNIKCTSSLIALDAAINAIKTGQCEYAIVAGINGRLNGEEQQQIGVVLVQKKTNMCRRFYAKVLHSKVCQQTNETYPVEETQSRLLKQIYAESDIDPALVTYIETHATGKSLNESQLYNTIADVFVSPRVQRTVPLFVGSTQTRMCHQEPVSGIVALVKMLVSIQRGIIPANLDYQEPCQEVSAMLDGRLKVVNSNTKFRGGLMALNSICLGGASAHLLLQPNNDYIMRRLGGSSFWNQDLTEMSTQPRLFQFCSRTEQGLEQIMEQIKRNPTDLATHFLLHPNSTSSPKTHPFRGYTILNGEREVQEIQKIQNQQEKPVWFVFPGMGSQWQGMGQEMMKVETFRQSIVKSAEHLKPYGLNLIDLIYGKQNVYMRPLNAFVGIAAVQIALVDCLRQAGVEAQGIIGHSVGELGCAYADNTLTAEETLLVALYRGKCIEEAQLPTGSMAVVGLSWEECQQRCPMGVVPAVHNGRELVTISGPKRAVVEFVQQLRMEGVYAKEIESSEVAFHSHHMTSIAPSMKMALEKVIRSPKLRSSKWISTSIPEQRWGTEMARYSSVDYHINNLCSPVLFQEALKYVPTNAIVVEVGPHAMLQEILKKSLSQQTTIVPLMNKQSVRQLEHFWTQLGRIYNQGINVDSVKLFVPVGREQTIYPVPVTTRFLSHYAKLNSQQMPVQYKTIGQKYYQQEEFTTVRPRISGEKCYQYTIDLNEESYLTGHQIEGRVVYPVTGYLCLVWKTLAKLNGFELEQFPVSFENVEIHRETIFDARDMCKQITFSVVMKPLNGQFEVIEGGNVIVSGRVYQPETPFEVEHEQYKWAARQQTQMKEQEEIYNELKMRGYEYQGEFQPIQKADQCGTRGELSWTGKWVPFLEAMLHMNVLAKKGEQLYMPRCIKSFTINPRMHLQTQKYVRVEELNKNVQPKYWQSTPFGGEQTLESLQQWQERYQQHHKQQQTIVEQLIQQQQQPEMQRMLLKELHQLIQEQARQILSEEQSVNQPRSARYQQTLEKLQQQLHFHNQQQKLVQKLMKQIAQQPEHIELLDELKQIVQEHQEYHLEQHLFEQERQQCINMFRSQFKQVLSIVQQLLRTPIYEQQQQLPREQQQLLEELETIFEQLKVQFQVRQVKQQKRQQSIKSWLQQLEQHQHIIERILRQQVPVQLRQVVQELERLTGEHKQHQMVGLIREQEIMQSRDKIEQQLHQQLRNVQQLLRQRTQPEEKRQLLEEIERFIQIRIQKVSVHEMKNQIHHEKNIRISSELQQIQEQVEQHIRKVRAQSVYTPKCHLMSELHHLNSQKQQMFQRLVSELQQQYQKQTVGDRCQQQLPIERLPVSRVYQVVFNPNTNKIVCGGIEIVGVHVTPVQITRRGAQFSRKIESGKHFVCGSKLNGEIMPEEYLQQNQRQQRVCEPISTESREFLECYLNECKRFTNYILKKIEQPTGLVVVPSSTIEQQFEKLSMKPFTTIELVQGGKLLQLLIQAANLESVDGQYFNKVQSLFNHKLAYWRALEEDLVLNHLNKRNVYLNNVLDTVFENNQRKLKVLEISPSCSQLFGLKINDVIKSHQHISCLDYNFVPTGHGCNSQVKQLLSELNHKLNFPVQKVEWNMGLRNGQLISEPPKHLQDFDLVIFNGSLSTLLPYVNGEQELKRWLQTVTEKVMQPQGFMLVKEHTNNFETLAELNRLEQVIFGQQPHLVQQGKYIAPIQKYQTHQQWNQLIQEAGFFPISSKSDSRLSTMSLYRRPINRIVSSEEKIFIDGMDQLNLIERVKEVIADRQLQRVWLISEKTPTSGIVGVINCLRKDIGGEKIRCLFIADKKPMSIDEHVYSSLNGQVKVQKPVQWTQLLDEIRRGDLVMNVYRNGKWSTLRKIFDNTLENLVIDNEKSVQSQCRSEKQNKWNSNTYVNLLSQGADLNEQRSILERPLIEVIASIINGHKTSKSLNDLNRRVNYLMPTRNIEKLNNIELEQQIPVVVIHPIEGHVNMLRSWAKNMKYPVYGMQYTQEAMQFESIEQLADFYWQQIEKELLKQNIMGQTRVHLCGFSFGGSVAIEMAARRSNRVASLTLLDNNTPTWMRNTRVQCEKPIEIELEALHLFAQQYLPTLCRCELVQELSQCTTLEQRIKHVVRELMTKSQFQFEPIDLEAAARSYVQKMSMSRKYQPKQTLRLSEVLLVKTGSQQQQQQQQVRLGEEYGLNQVFCGKIQVQTVEGDNRSLFEGNNGLQLAGILNENLLRFF